MASTTLLNVSPCRAAVLGIYPKVIALKIGALYSRTDTVPLNFAAMAFSVAFAVLTVLGDAQAT